MPRDDELYEVVDGERIEKPLMSAYAGKVGSGCPEIAFSDDKDWAKSSVKCSFGCR